tara:strand:- start:32995 stop:33186 length:192 start_codon:yes stop_codon:yes gene_type:complete
MKTELAGSSCQSENCNTLDPSLTTWTRCKLKPQMGLKQEKGSSSFPFLVLQVIVNLKNHMIND